MHERHAKSKRLTDNQRCLEAGLRLVDVVHPVLVPRELEGHERARDLVVHLYYALGLLPREDVLVLLELLHRLLDPLEEMARPGDVAGDGRHVAGHGRVLLQPLV